MVRLYRFAGGSDAAVEHEVRELARKSIEREIAAALAEERPGSAHEDDEAGTRPARPEAHERSAANHDEQSTG